MITISIDEPRPTAVIESFWREQIVIEEQAIFLRTVIFELDKAA